MADPRLTNQDEKTNTARDTQGDKSARDDQKVAPREKVVNDPGTQDAVAKVLNGELKFEDAQKKYPEIAKTMQSTVGNEVVEFFMKGGAEKKKPEDKSKETSKEGAEKKDDAKAPAKVDPKAESEAKLATMVLGIVGAKMGITHLLKDKDAKEQADPTKKEAAEKKEEAAKKTEGAEKKDDKKVDDTKKVDDLKKTDKQDEKDKKDSGASQESKEKSDQLKAQAGGELAKSAGGAKKKAKKKHKPKLRRRHHHKHKHHHHRKPKRHMRRRKAPKKKGEVKAPEPEQKVETPTEQPPVENEAKEQETEQKTEEPAAEKKEETTTEPAAEKKDEKKDPGAEKKEEPEEKKEEPGAEKKEEPGAEKKEEPGAEKKEEEKKEEPGAEKKDEKKEEPGAEKKKEEPKTEPGAEKKDEKTPGGGGSEKKEETTPGGGGGGTQEIKDPAPQPVAEPPQMTGPGGTMDSYMATHPDPAARDRVTNLGYVTDKYERSSKELGGKVELPPDKAWYDAVTPRQEWFAFKQKIGNNPWQGQDTTLAFMHNLNAGLDLVSSVVSKIGLAATIGGVILTFLVPPVGAFLLTVGRVCNGISAVLAGVKLIVSIVQTIMIAVKAAKEKDPLKRMEMMQQMKSSIQSGVMAGIDLILSKVGGGAKGAAGTAGSKAMDAAKTAFKSAREGGAGIIKAGLKAGAAGAGAFVKGLGTAMKEGFKGMKNSAKEGLKALKNDGVLKTIGKGLKSAGSAMKGAVTKPFSEIKQAWGGFSSVKKSWQQFTSGVSKNGYLKTIGQMNFKNAMGGKTFTEKMKGAWKDATDKSAGGAATQIDMFMNGKSDKNKGKNNKQEVENHAREAKEKKAALESAMKGSVTEQRQYLAKEGKQQYKDLRHIDDDTIKHMMLAKQKELGKKMSFGPQVPGLGEGINLATGVYGVATGKKDGWDLAKTGMQESGSPALKTASKFMVNSKSVGDDKAKQKSWVQEAAELNEKRSGKAVEGVQAQLQKSAKGGLTEAKCKSAMGPAFTAMAKREQELQSMMGQTGDKSAAPTPDASATPEVQGPPPPPPAPPAPPEGTVVPEESLLADIKGQRTKLAAVKSSVQGHVKRAEEQKAQAMKGDATLTQYAAGLDKQQAEVTQQETEASKDKVDIEQSKAKIAEGGKQVSDKKGIAEGEKGKASEQASKGAAVNVVPDKAKQQAEEQKRAAEEKAKEDAEYKKASALGKLWKGATKVVKSIGSFLASAAKWVWEKMIAPAIAAVKAAVAKVMNYITNMLMSGIIKIIGLIMGKEAENNLNQTFTQMKAMEAEQAKQAATETKGKNTEAKLKLTKAQQAAKGKIDTCQANIAEGNGLIGEIDAHDAALQAEEQKIVADREAFRAQYSPYFDWVKLYEEWQAKNGDKGGDKKPPQTQPGGDKQPGGPANQGNEAQAGENPVDRGLEPAIGQALGSAAEVVKSESQASQDSVAKGAKEKGDAVKAAAKAAYDANMADLKAASEKEKTKDMSEAYGRENDRVTQTNANADQVVAAVTGQHGKVEGERRARLDQLIARANALTGKKAQEGLNEAKELWKQISEEAKGIDPAQEQAFADLAAGFAKMGKS